MILDTSAIIALLKSESSSDRIAQAIESEPQRRLSAGTLLELFVVADSNDELALGPRLDEFLLLVRPSVEPVTEAQARIARLAYRTYGKGRGHRAQLNFGDCFAYALARDRNEPLLFVGDDFGHTDIRSALDP